MREIFHLIFFLDMTPIMRRVRETGTLPTKQEIALFLSLFFGTSIMLINVQIITANNKQKSGA